MKLLRFRVTNFRSVEDSGMVDVGDIASTIGINESGKSNLLLPLWKLNPAYGGEIRPMSDFPRSKYTEFRDAKDKPVFVEAEFSVPSAITAELAKVAGCEAEEVSVARFRRKYDGNYYINFPKEKPSPTIKKSAITTLLSKTLSEIEGLSAVPGEEELKGEILTAIKAAQEAATKSGVDLGKEQVEAVAAELEEVELPEAAAEYSAIQPRFSRLISELDAEVQKVSKPKPSDVKDARQLALKHLPKFVYYSNYGNLDSEIYLPHVIQNMERDDLGSKEEAKVRTLKVLFDFVNLKPSEILELGKEAPNANPEQIAAAAEKKRERDILLQSAGTRLTKEFREWWKQGDYRFRFAADGNHFRIWVSDDKRPEDIELEGRSTGLQWFLSFFLVFLVESKDAHDGAILLLDEPGITLHPLAQKDLSRFFEGLAEENQLIYSTHSPFMIDPDHLDRVKAVFTDEAGKTKVSSDLRAAAPSALTEKSIYAAHAALGLSISDVILQGCEPVIVEGPSDQRYLAAIKSYLSSHKLLQSPREIVFVPGGGGVRGIKAVASILSAKDNQMPFVILDSDGPGKELAKSLRGELYKGQEDRVVLVGELLSKDGAEIEDLMSPTLIADAFSREYRAREEDFNDVLDDSALMVPQMEAFAEKHSFALPTGWKVDLATVVKRKMGASATRVDQELESAWGKLFSRFAGVQAAAKSKERKATAQPTANA